MILDSGASVDLMEESTFRELYKGKVLKAVEVLNVITVLNVMKS